MISSRSLHQSWAVIGCFIGFLKVTDAGELQLAVACLERKAALCRSCAHFKSRHAAAEQTKFTITVLNPLQLSTKVIRLPFSSALIVMKKVNSPFYG